MNKLDINLNEEILRILALENNHLNNKPKIQTPKLLLNSQVDFSKRRITKAKARISFLRNIIDLSNTFKKEEITITVNQELDDMVKEVNQLYLYEHLTN